MTATTAKMVAVEKRLAAPEEPTLARLRIQPVAVVPTEPIVMSTLGRGRKGEIVVEFDRAMEALPTTLDELLVIAGESIQGTAYGVYRFLETQGMKFFAPGVHSAVGKTNILNAVHAADRPFFNGKRAPGRWCVYGDESGFALADPRNAGIDAVFPGDRTQWIDHTSAFLVPKKYY